MRYVAWIFKLALFLLVLSFAVKNTEIVTVRYYLGYEWQAPLVLVLLVVFCLGAAVGVAAGLGGLLRRQREISALRRELRSQERPGAGATARPDDAV